LEEEMVLLEKLNQFKKENANKKHSEEYSVEYLAYKEFLEKGIINFKEILTKLSTTYEK
jgi:hypothetical protein